MAVEQAPVPLQLPTRWRVSCSSEVACTPSAFAYAAEQITEHPEHSSSEILRAEPLYDHVTDAKGKGKATDASFAEYKLQDDVQQLQVTRRKRRKLVAKKAFDGDLEQEVVFADVVDSDDKLVLLLPDLDEAARRRERGQAPLPFYHPRLAGVALRYSPSSDSTARLSVEAAALPDTLQEGGMDAERQERGERICAQILKRAVRVAKGQMMGYEKRVHHDLLVERNAVQDLYGELKDRYKNDILAHDPRITFRHLLKDWKESTDPEKHVFEDCAIAAFLILLWRQLYPDGRPYFVDIGCGNGLLVHILAQEGYEGYGFDIRSRKSWESYPGKADLRESTINPADLVLQDEPPFPPGAFLIGNHADELTPWVPLLAAVTPGSSFLNIPCCLHELAGRFSSAKYAIPHEVLDDLEPNTATLHPLLEAFYAPTPSMTMQSGRYWAFQLYLAHLTLLSGFVPEREALRIPSTKNYGMVGRKRLWERPGVSSERAQEMQAAVKDQISELALAARATWTPRPPQAKAH